MIRKLSLALDEEERALCDSAPEECFRHAIRRGALSLDEATARLSPRIAAVIRSIATGERLTALDPETTRSIGAQLTPPDRPQSRERSQERETTRKVLAGHPQLTQMLDERILGPGEALGIAQALDTILGRYMTGTKYAAP